MGLGTLRFVLSLLVIDAHYGFFGQRVQMAAVNRFGIDQLAYVGSGGIAVSGFFVVSGYLITLVLTRKYDTGWNGAKAFYVSRALRIYPLYWLLFALYWLALESLRAPPAIGGLRFAGNVSLIPYGVYGMVADRNAMGLANLTDTMLIGPAWTLCYDLLFYLLAPWLFVKARPTWGVAVVGLAYFAAFILFADPRPPMWYQFFYETGMPYLFMFACGALAYHYREALRVGPRIVGALIAGLLWITYFPLGLPNTFVNHLLVALLFSPLVAVLGQQAHAPRVDRVLGDLTYATYLLHLPLLILAQRLAWPAAPLLALALTYIGGLVLLWVFELPLDRVRDRLYLRSRHQLPAGARRIPVAVPVALTFMIVAAATVSLTGNLWRAGDTVVVNATACPAQWRCEGGRIAFSGMGRVELAPALPQANRIVVDLDVPAGVGTVWAGFASTDGRIAVGIRREGEICHLEVADPNGGQSDPEGWSGECRPHRLAFDFATGRLRAVVDSLWVVTTSSAPDAVRASVRADAGSHGIVNYANVFKTQR